jgi:hypothetical protein
VRRRRSGGSGAPPHPPPPLRRDGFGPRGGGAAGPARARGGRPSRLLHPGRLPDGSVRRIGRVARGLGWGSGGGARGAHERDHHRRHSAGPSSDGPARRIGRVARGLGTRSAMISRFRWVSVRWPGGLPPKRDAALLPVDPPPGRRTAVQARVPGVMTGAITGTWRGDDGGRGDNEGDHRDVVG